MKRRDLLYSLLGVSSLPSFLEAQKASSEVQKPSANDAIPAATDEVPRLSVSSPEAVASGVPAFFKAAEFVTFRHLGQVLMPAIDGQPGALEATAAEFLDFLLSESPSELQTLYRNGVRQLDSRSTERFRRTFTKLQDQEVAVILAPLSEPWTYRGPSDPFGQFLNAAKVAFWQATVNSRQWAEAGSGRRRSAAGVNTYWLPFE